MWKTTDRYVQQKRVKAVEAESKLKQVYIPNYTKPNPALITNNSKSNLLNGTANGNNNNNNNDILALTSSNGKPCESCSSSSAPNWYTWGPSHLSCRLCQTCWNYWKKYGGLKTASRLADNDVDAMKKRPVENVDEEERISSAHRQSSNK
jgi:metastasis-associated protein MTA